MNSTEDSAQSTSARLGECEVCNVNDAKYTCPRCEVKSCSLNCSSIHKNELNCSGQRDRTKYIPIDKFTNLDLLSDYRLLEEISRTVQASKKEKFNRRFKLSKKQIRLQIEARKRRVEVKFLPDKFVKRKNNSSWYNIKNERIEWHLELFFVNSDLKLSEEQVPETERLNSILHKYLTKQETEVLQEKLQFYQAVDFPGIKLLLKAEGRTGNKFYELDANSTLREALRNKIIIEYPTIYVLLKDHYHLYDILDSDDDEDNGFSDSKQKVGQNPKLRGEQVINNIVRKAEKDDGTSHPLKNLLFATDFSDDSEND